MSARMNKIRSYDGAIVYLLLEMYLLQDIILKELGFAKHNATQLQTSPWGAGVI